ncbi:MAG: hypothetical protein HYV63_06275 [Candidatus Schekmanbacteria bacterium]|nr:hypothetical protein [Candidatus Schekmanbacteria bacterium]
MIVSPPTCRLAVALLILTVASRIPCCLAASAVVDLVTGAVLPKVDGEISEWQSLPPSLHLGPENQVAGKQRATDSADFSATVWARFTDEGFVVAGRVIDDALHLANSPDELIASDHPEVWLAFPPPAFPPIGFANQFGEVALETPEACTDNEDTNLSEPAACRAWHADQVRRRALLSRLFVRQYGIGAAGIHEYYAAVASNLFPDAAPCCPHSRSSVVPGAEGYTFEVLIGREDFPATGTWPLATARVLIDIADNDTGSNAQEKFFSSRQDRKFGDPGTFDAVTLPDPLAPDTRPPVAARLLHGDGGAIGSVFYYPGSAALEQLFALQNLGVGYQYEPSSPSPSIVKLRIASAPGELEEVVRFGDIAVYTVPTEVSYAGTARSLMAFRGDHLLSSYAQGISSAVRAAVPAAHGALALVVYDGPASLLGAGMCGVCRLLRYELVSIAGDGAFKLECADRIMDQSPVEDVSGAMNLFIDGIELSWAADLSEVTLKGSVTSYAESDKPAQVFTATHRWDAGSGTCVAVEPAPAGS